MTKRLTMIYKTLHRKLNIEHHEPNNKNRVKRRCSGRVAVPASLVAPAVLIWLKIRWPVISEDGTGPRLRQAKHVRNYLSHKYSLTINQFMLVTVKRHSGDLNISIKDPWFSRFVVSSNPLAHASRQQPQDLQFCISWDICTPYLCASGISLHIYG